MTNCAFSHNQDQGKVASKCVLRKSSAGDGDGDFYGWDVIKTSLHLYLKSMCN